jgi:drug/metabolite transporter (DMT)-like permease
MYTGRSMPLEEVAALVTLAALWGGSFLFIRIAAPALGPLPMAAGRVLLAGLLLWVGARAVGQRPALRPHLCKLLVLGLLNAAIPFALIGAAELELTASLASMLNATVPMFAALLGAVWLGERLTRARVAGLLLGVVGVGALLGWSPITLDAGTLTAIGAMLVATFCYALAGVYAKRELAGAPTTTLALGQQVGAAAWLVLPAAARLPAAHPTPGALLAVVALASLSTAVAYVLYFFLIARVGPTRTYTVTYLIPVFGVLWGALFLGEPVTRGMLAGLACILASVTLVNGVSLGIRWPGRRVRPAAGECTAV